MTAGEIRPAVSADVACRTLRPIANVEVAR